MNNWVSVIFVYSNTSIENQVKTELLKVTSDYSKIIISTSE